ncbi:hypothetical protein V1514DRAFT_276615 [Lipomyces japonicus]|uniref:uncharacterized protein n=1 Tax=Lipomyces japonicus TaxID=56871 RepID=UPI0034CEAC24
MSSFIQQTKQPSMFHMSATHDHNVPVDAESSNAGTQLRKRRRVPVVCSMCRQKKLKCNRMQPCSACVTHNTTTLCVYAVKPWICDPIFFDYQTSPDSSSGLAASHLSGQAPIARFVSNPTAVIQSTSSSPFETSHAREDCQTFQPIDPTQTPEYKELKKRIEQLEGLVSSAVLHNGSILDSSSVLHSSKSETKLISDDRFPVSSVVGLSSMSQADFPEFTPNLAVKKNRMVNLGRYSSFIRLTQDPYIQEILGTNMAKSCLVNNEAIKEDFRSLKRQRKDERLFGDKNQMNSEQLEIVNKLFNVDFSKNQRFPLLEHRPLCDFLIARFMQRVNVLFPIVHPVVFRNNLKKFWDSKQKASFQASQQDGTMKTERKTVLRGLALFAIVVRLGRLSLPQHWKPSDDGFPDEYNIFLGRSLYAYSWECLREANYMVKSDFVVTQVLLGFRIHFAISPEGGEGADMEDSANFVGHLCQVGLSMGLHRDPKLFPKVPPQMADAWRVTFALLVIFDTERSLDLTLPFAIPLEMSDTPLHNLPSFGENIVESELPSTSFIEVNLKLSLLARSILGKIMLPNFTMSRNEFKSHCEELRKFEEEYLSSFQLLLEVIHRDKDATLSGPDGAYDLAQKYILQLQLSRLQLVLYSAYKVVNEEEAHENRMAMIVCSLKMLDTMATFISRQHFFSDFLWMLIKFSMRHFTYPTCTILHYILKGLKENCEIFVEFEGQRWKNPDLSFQYNASTISNYRRLYQSLMITAEWIHTYRNLYDIAWKAEVVVSLLVDIIKSKIANYREGIQKAAQRMIVDAYTPPASPLPAILKNPKSFNIEDIIESNGVDDFFSQFAAQIGADADIGEWWHDWAYYTEEMADTGLR